MNQQDTDFDVKYFKGKKNIVVDALLKGPTAAALCSLSEISTDRKS